MATRRLKSKFRRTDGWMLPSCLPATSFLPLVGLGLSPPTSLQRAELTELRWDLEIRKSRGPSSWMRAESQGHCRTRLRFLRCPGQVLGCQGSVLPISAHVQLHVWPFRADMEDFGAPDLALFQHRLICPIVTCGPTWSRPSAWEAGWPCLHLCRFSHLLLNSELGSRGWSKPRGVMVIRESLDGPRFLGDWLICLREELPPPPSSSNGSQLISPHSWLLGSLLMVTSLLGYLLTTDSILGHLGQVFPSLALFLI